MTITKGIARKNASAPLEAATYDDLPATGPHGQQAVVTAATKQGSWTRYEANGPFVPAEIYPLISGYVSNASGDAKILPADALADVTGRGFTTSLAGSGDVTKTADSGLVVSTGVTNASEAELRFVPTVAPSKSLLVVRLAFASSSSNARNLNPMVGDGTRYVRLTALQGDVPGVLSLIDSVGTKISEGEISLTFGVAHWLFVYADFSTDEAVSRAWSDENAGQQLAAQRTSLAAVAGTHLNLFTKNGTTGINHQFDVSELHWFEL